MPYQILRRCNGHKDMIWVLFTDNRVASRTNIVIRTIETFLRLDVKWSHRKMDEDIHDVYP